MYPEILKGKNGVVRQQVVWMLGKVCIKWNVLFVRKIYDNCNPDDEIVDMGIEIFY